VVDGRGIWLEGMYYRTSETDLSFDIMTWYLLFGKVPKTCGRVTLN